VFEHLRVVPKLFTIYPELGGVLKGLVKKRD
jgi:hypothetical protein